VSLAQRTVREARRVVAGLRPTVLDDFGLATALRQQVEALVAEGWQATYRQDLDGARLLPSMETALFRISQEAIANARKHSRAHRLHLSLTKKRDSLRLLVRDWGRGFDPDLLDGQAAPGERVGLAGMQERVSLLGGTLRITSRPGHGVRVIAEVPLDSATSGASTVRRARRSGDTAG